MNDFGLSEFKLFNGKLSANGNTIALVFRARIDPSGEVQLDLGMLPRNQETYFIEEWWPGQGSQFGDFSLQGTAEGGTTFETSDLNFSSAKRSFDQAEGWRLRPVGSCSTATFHCKLSTKVDRPLLKRTFKGFQNLGSLHATCPLGAVAMDGDRVIAASDAITGWAAIQAQSAPADHLQWRAEGERLLEHLRRVMSFASAVVLRAPILEFYYGEDLEIVAWSQTTQSKSVFRTFDLQSQQPIFDAAVTSFFNPPTDAKNLFLVIEWFAMDTTYNEVRLVNAMTAIENLLDSNLSDDDAFIQSRRIFERTRRTLKQVIALCLRKWPPDTADEVIDELNEKLTDLNRRSLLRKLERLAARWSVPLEDIGFDRIRAAKQARDRVIHRGQYYEDRRVDDPALWDHVEVIREVVTRFLLTGIGYRGGYNSYLGGYHPAQFPPVGAQNTSRTKSAI